MGKNDIKSENLNLLQKGRDLRKKIIAKPDSQYSEAELLKFIHDFEALQIELEAQNEELRHAKDRMEVIADNYAELYDFAPSGYFTLSREGRIIALNLKGADMVGKVRSRVKSSLFSQFISEETKPNFDLFLTKVFNSNIKETCEVTLLPSGNYSFEVHLEGIVAINLEQCLLTVVDISNRKEAENLLHQTRENYETFFNTISDFLFVLDETGNIVHTNSTVNDRLNYTKEELLGQSVLMVHTPERRDEALRIVGEMLRGEVEFCPVPLITKSGIQIPVETRVNPGIWNGKPALFGVTKDISKIQLSEEKFSKVFFLNPSACGLTELDTGKFIEVNEAFCTLLGFSKEEVIGKSATELGILTQDFKNTILNSPRNNERIINVKADLKTKNGIIKHVLLSADSIYIQEKKFRYTVVHDITEHK